MFDLPEDERTPRRRKALGWLSAMIGLILLNVYAALPAVSKSSVSGLATFVGGLALLALALRLVRSPN